MIPLYTVDFRVLQNALVQRPTYSCQKQVRTLKLQHPCPATN